jgi:hypothetical protein
MLFYFLLLLRKTNRHENYSLWRKPSKILSIKLATYAAHLFENKVEVLDLNDFKCRYLRLISKKRNWSTRVSKAFLDKIATAGFSSFNVKITELFSSFQEYFLTGALDKC